MNSTPRLKLPFITPGQAQKDLSHNEALQLIDLLLMPVVEMLPLNAPPDGVLAGECYLVGAAPTGDWAGRAHALAGYSDSGWRFVEPRLGMLVYVRSEGVSARFGGSDWDVGAISGSQLLIGGRKVVGSRAGSIATPAGGKRIDVEARAALSEVLDALRGHGLIET